MLRGSHETGTLRRGSLVGLPSQGLLTVQPGQLGYKQRSAAPKYISLHSTAPPPGQVVRTDPTNILIRSLQRNAKKPVSTRERTRATAGSSGSFSASSRPEAAAAGTGATTAAMPADGTGSATIEARQWARPAKTENALKRPKPLDVDDDANAATGEQAAMRRQRRAGT